MAQEQADAKKKWAELTNQEWVDMMWEKKIRKKRQEFHMIPRLPEDFEFRINQRFPDNGEEKQHKKVVLIIQKTLTASDVDPIPGRLSIPCTEVETFSFLKEEEIGLLRKEHNIELLVFHKTINDADVHETHLHFSQKNQHKNARLAERVSSHYVLKLAWNRLVSEDGLETGDTVQCWAVRDKDDKLVAMAVVKIQLFVNNPLYRESSHHHGFNDPLKCK